MPRGNAFSRTEVDSVDVETTDRFVVSYIYGVSPFDANTPEEAASIALGQIRAGNLGSVKWIVFDRMTGQTHEFFQENFEGT